MRLDSHSFIHHLSMDLQTYSHLSSQFHESLPQEWSKCSPLSEGVIGNLFVVFKTPFGQKFKLNPCHLRFTPQTVFDTVQIQGLGQIKLWINLASTRHYDIKEITDNGADYAQVHTTRFNEGNDLPCPEDVAWFYEKCNQFVKTRESARDLIGIHSTLGYNITGYFICSYLMKFGSGNSLDFVLDEYRVKRPNGIYNPELLNDLVQKFGSEKLHTTLSPKWLPPRNRAQNSKQNPEFFIQTPLIAQPVIDAATITSVQQQIQEICDFKKGGFPGRTFVTLGMETIHYLKELKYYISLKKDGRRYFLYIDDNSKAFFMDRETTVFSLCTKQTSKWLGWFASGSGLSSLRNSLWDGEILVNKLGNPIYIVFDVLQHQMKNFIKCPFGERYDYLKKCCIVSALSELNTDLRFELTVCHDISEIETIFKSLDEDDKNEHGYEHDGLIFENIDEIYVTGSCDTILKWKPDDQSTVDFRLEIEKDGLTGKLYVASFFAPLGKITITEELNNLDGHIIECSRQGSGNEWRFLRERQERINPNEYNTAMEVVSNILRPVSRDYLVQFIQDIMHERAVTADTE